MISTTFITHFKILLIFYIIYTTKINYIEYCLYSLNYKNKLYKSFYKTFWKSPFYYMLLFIVYILKTHKKYCINFCIYGYQKPEVTSISQ